MSRNWPTLSSVRSSFHIRHTGSVSADEQLVGEHEGEVAGEDRRALTEAPRLSGPAVPAMPVGVHTWVVGSPRRLDASSMTSSWNSAKRVHQLEGGAGVDDALVVRVATGADEPPVAERRPQPLAACLDHAADLVERSGEVGVERAPALPCGGDDVEDRSVTRAAMAARLTGAAAGVGRAVVAGSPRSVRCSLAFARSSVGGRGWAVEVGDHLVDAQAGGADPLPADGDQLGRPGDAVGELVDVDVAGLQLGEDPLQLGERGA